MRRTYFTHRRGFSLIELLIAIAMIGILAGLVLPRVRLERSQVDAAARTLGTALMTARSDAVARGHNVLVVLDTGNGVVRTVWDLNNNRRVDASEKSRPFLLGERITFGRGAGIPPFEGATAQVPALLTTGGDAHVRGTAKRRPRSGRHPHRCMGTRAISRSTAAR